MRSVASRPTAGGVVSQGSLCGGLELFHERELRRHVSVGAGASNVPTHERVELPVADLLYLLEYAGTSCASANRRHGIQPGKMTSTTIRVRCFGA